MKYPKIHSIYKRDEDHKFIVGEYSCPEFANIDKWLCQEKIDGTNIRINYCYYSILSKNILCIKGRTDEASIPPKLLAILKYYFNEHTLIKLLPEDRKDLFNYNITLYGEGYGPQIQKNGGNYIDHQSFILFDVKINNWWLKQEDVKEIAHRLNINYAPIVGIMTKQEAIDYVKSKPQSLCSITPQVMEGLILRPDPLMLFRDGTPIIMKIKVKDCDGC